MFDGTLADTDDVELSCLTSFENLLRPIPSLTCRTIPVAHLRLGDSNDDIVIMVEVDKFVINDTFTFDVEAVNVDPVSCKEGEDISANNTV
jgi:hypothetical protein